MSSFEERRRNNIKAGVFVTICLLAAFSVVLTLGEAWRTFERTNDYVVSFAVSSGIGYLAEGAEVRIGGVRMGEVAQIEPLLDHDPFDTIHVHLRLDHRVTLYDDAVIHLNAPLIGKEAWIDIPSTGRPETGSPVTADHILIATEATGFLTALLGPDNAARTSSILESADRTTSFLETLPDEYDRRLVPLLEDLAITASHARAVTERLGADDYPRWATAIDDVLVAVDRTVSEIEQMIRDGREIARGIDEVVTGVDGAIAKNRPEIDAIIANLRQASDEARELTETLNRDTVDRVNALLDRGVEGVDTFAALLERLQVDVDAEMPGLRETLANGRLASQQLKLASIEIRRSPWRLLYRPSAGELEHELLYETARSFAMAVSDLKAATDAIERVMTRHGETLTPDDPNIDRMRSHLLDTFDRYERVQQRLLDVLLTDQP